MAFNGLFGSSHSTIASFRVLSFICLFIYNNNNKNINSVNFSFMLWYCRRSDKYYTHSIPKYKQNWVKETWYIWFKIWTKYIHFCWPTFAYILGRREYTTLILKLNQMKMFNLIMILSDEDIDYLSDKQKTNFVKR
jgi:hypothetical protein